jgi:hypothetical protein
MAGLPLEWAIILPITQEHPLAPIQLKVILFL